MKKSKLVVRLFHHKIGYTPMSWSGKATAEALERFVMAFTVSTYKGKANEQIGETYGITLPSRAFIVENKPGGKIIAEWHYDNLCSLPDASDYPEVN